MKPITIESCEFELKCPKSWDALIDDGKETNSRFCNTCDRRVYLCNTDGELAAHVDKRDCIAIRRFTPDSTSGLYSVGVPRFSDWK